MTLIEMLVVLAIIGIAAGAVALGLGSAARGSSAESEARRLAARIQLVADDTMVTDRPVAFAADATGYRFLGWNPRKGGWTPGATDLLDRHDLPSGIRLTTTATMRAPVPIGMDGAGAAIDARIVSGGDRWRVRYDGLTTNAEREGAR